MRSGCLFNERAVYKIEHEQFKLKKTQIVPKHTLYIFMFTKNLYKCDYKYISTPFKMLKCNQRILLHIPFMYHSIWTFESHIMGTGEWEMYHLWWSALHCDTWSHEAVLWGKKHAYIQYHYSQARKVFWRAEEKHDLFINRDTILTFSLLSPLYNYGPNLNTVNVQGKKPADTRKWHNEL